jgi:hypothetical protein
MVSKAIALVSGSLRYKEDGSKNKADGDKEVRKLRGDSLNEKGFP